MRKILFTVLSLILTLVFQQAFAQERTVSGKITDKATGEAMPSVTVAVKGTTKGTITDLEGTYKLSIDDKDKVLQFTFIGYKTVEVEIGTQSMIDMVMSEAATDINEVLVVGYGTALKQDLTGNIAKIQSKDIQNAPVPSFEQAIQGRAAGVFIESQNGKVGGGIKMRIRGSSSIGASNEPLYVVDGIMITSSSQAAETTSSVNPLAELNTNDIASIEILKDASASAIYGARAANGVVIITTKKGQQGKTKFNLGYQYGTSSPTGKREFLNTQQYVELFREAGKNSDDEAFALRRIARYSNGAFVAANPTDLSKLPNTDWQDLVFNKDAGIAQLDFSVSGGTEKTKFFASGQRSSQTGILINNSMERYSGRLNVDHKDGRFSTGFSMSVARNQLKRVSDDNAFSTPMQIVALSPITPVRDTNGVLFDTPVTTYYNPLIDTEDSKFTSTALRTLGSAYAGYEIMKGLSIKTEFGLDIYNLNEDRFWGKRTEVGRTNNRQGSSSMTGVVNYTTSTYLNYVNTFAEKHNINVTVGQSYQNSRTDFTNASGQGFPSDRFQKIASASVKNDASSTLTQFSFLSYFARANYKFNNRYLLTLSGRMDGSSRFGEDSRYGFFPAASAGWIITEEAFLKENKIVSFLKLRASYGLTGNAEIANFSHLPLIGTSLLLPSSLTGITGYVGTPSTRITQLPNSNLRWEQTTQFDIGLDYGILKDRITGEIDFYQKNTTDLLLNVPIPATSGFPTQTQNIGSLKNYGVEFVVNTANLVGNFKWNTSFNFSMNSNEITSIGGDELIDVRGSRGLNVVKVGQPIGVFYGKEYAGVDPANGDALFYKNTDGTRATTNDWNEAKDIVLGNPNPSHIGGISNSFAYKGFELSVLFQWVSGNQVYNSAGGFMSASADWFDNQTTDQLRRWQKPGDVTDVPQLRLGAGNGIQTSSRYLSDASYIRLKNLQFAYNFPKKLITKAKLETARLYIVGQNLLTFTSYKGWDPEVNSDYLGNSTTNANVFQGVDFYSAPQLRTITVGLSLGF
jgi:TonB-linked SusC/RagA family outer membrane protein